MNTLLEHSRVMVRHHQNILIITIVKYPVFIYTTKTKIEQEEEIKIFVNVSNRWGEGYKEKKVNKTQKKY